MDKRSITSANNGKLGGRPVATKTLVTQQMREELITAVRAKFKDIYEPQIKKATEGDFNAYRDLMDRVGLKAQENLEGNIFVPIQIVIKQSGD